MPAQLDEKFNRLKKDYGIMCELEDSITSLGFIMQVLMQQRGEVKAAQLDERGELVLELKVLEIVSEGSGPEPAKGKLTISARYSRRVGLSHFPMPSCSWFW